MASSMETATTITSEIRAWLMRELRFPVMATIGKDAMPKLSVIWFDLDPDRDDVVLLNTLAGRVKDRQLRRDPRVSLCFEDGTEYVTVEGRAELFDDREKAMANIWAMAHRYGQGEGSFAMGDRVDIVVHVERVIRHR
ncbi:MAG: TIGR03618 family F420-dependent PPOX class oxidoreductase [Chloroflexota bacterium]